MAPISSLSLFKETRTDLEPLHPCSLIQIQVPSTSTFSIKARQQRRVRRGTPSYKDEDSYTKSLASSGSHFFGRARKYPRTFLWRVLQEGKVLELRSADLSKSNRETKEASLIIQLCFPTAIRNGGVALADPEDLDALSVFALTKSNELYTFTIHKDIFCRIRASEEDVARWCKVSKPSTFSISTPHKLVAGSSLQLIVSLIDGRLLQLTRNKGDDGSKWHETTYGDGQWASSLRGLVRWQGNNVVKYDGTTLEQGTPIAIALSPDRKHVFAVCLNHSLRIWNLSRAASVFSKDLLWQRREPHDIPRVMLDPGIPNVLQVFQANGAIEGDLYYALTFSPHDFGQFKFWAVRDPDHSDRGIRDLFPDDLLRPPDPDPSPESKAIWKVADFTIKSSHQQRDLELWVLMRSNRSHSLYVLRSEIQDIPSVWNKRWSTAASEAVDSGLLPQMSDHDPDDATEKWLDCILYPGRYPEPSLETALTMYCSERSIDLPSAKGSLKEKMCSAIRLQVESSTADQNMAQYRKAINHEWAVLFQDIRELDKSRWEILSLGYDNVAQMSFIVFADGSSAIRTCDRVEVIAQNDPLVLGDSMGMLEAPSIESGTASEPKLPDELATMIAAAAAFRQSFSYDLRQIYNSVLAEELWLDPSFSIPLRIQSFYDRCNFGEETGTTSFDDLTAALERIGGFNGLDTNTCYAILDEFSHNLPNERADHTFTLYGRKMLISGAQDMIAMREKLLSDLLALIVFVDMEIDRDEMPMENFDAPPIYAALVEMLRQHHIMQWLASHSRVEESRDPTRPATPDTAMNGADNNNNNAAVSTVLENLFAIYVAAHTHEMQSQSEALSNNIKDLLKWTVGGDDYTVTMDQVPVYVQTNLLANDNIELASDFLKYQPSTAWSTYIKGRLSLLKGETLEASIYLKKAAFILCMLYLFSRSYSADYFVARPSEFDYAAASNGLLTPMDALSFGNGLPTYYTHILNLFDATSHPTQMSQFAHLALQLTPTPSDSISSAQTSTLLTSLFQASLQTTDFSTAYTALTRHPAPSTLLPSLISALLSTPNALPQLLAFPFPPSLYSDIDALLAAHRKDPKILAAWRLHHNSFRGAAAALLPPLQAKQAQAKKVVQHVEDDYLTVINLLACAGKENAWVLSREGKDKRAVITIEDVRRGYQKELDQRSVIENGRFGFGDGGGEGDEMDVL